MFTLSFNGIYPVQLAVPNICPLRLLADAPFWTLLMIHGTSSEGYKIKILRMSVYR
jgi:hypothetical protein